MRCGRTPGGQTPAYDSAHGSDNHFGRLAGIRVQPQCVADHALIAADDRVAWIPQAFVAYAIRTDSGGPSSSMRFSTRMAMPTSVARRASVRDRSASPPWPSWLWIAAEHTASAISEENSSAIEASVRQGS